MPISAVGSSSYQQVTLPTAATKPTVDTDAPAATTQSTTQSTTQGASQQAKPDTDAAAASTGGQGKGSSAQQAVNLTKINPDGTVGPLHLHRHPNSPGVFHA